MASEKPFWANVALANWAVNCTSAVGCQPRPASSFFSRSNAPRTVPGAV